MTDSNSTSLQKVTMFGIISFIAIALFVVIGFGAVRSFMNFGKFQNRVFDLAQRRMDQLEREADQTETPRNYECDQCGAALDEPDKISPDGHFVCAYCGKLSHINR